MMEQPRDREPFAADAPEGELPFAPHAPHGSKTPDGNVTSAVLQRSEAELKRVSTQGFASSAKADEDALPWPDGETDPLAGDDPEADDRPLDSTHLWEGDAGTLPHDARAALLRLVKGPYISESGDAALWRALLNHSDTIRSRLADLFLDLVIDSEAGVAFAKNVSAEGREFPKAATSYTLTLIDTIMVLLLRKELQTVGSGRVFIGQADLFLQMNQYRAIAKVDQAAYLKRLEASWSRLEKQRLLVKSDVEGRYEISPVLKLVFGAEEAQAVFEEYGRMRDQLAEGDTPASDGDEAATEGGTLFDGLI